MAGAEAVLEPAPGSACCFEGLAGALRVGIFLRYRYPGTNPSHHTPRPHKRPLWGSSPGKAERCSAQDLPLLTGPAKGAPTPSCPGGSLLSTGTGQDAGVRGLEAEHWEVAALLAPLRESWLQGRRAKSRLSIADRTTGTVPEVAGGGQNGRREASVRRQGSWRSSITPLSVPAWRWRGARGKKRAGAGLVPDLRPGLVLSWGEFWTGMPNPGL